MAEAMSEAQAIDALIAMEGPIEEAPVVAAEPEEVEEVETAEGEEPEAGEEAGEEEETVEAEAEPVDAPQWWDAEDKAVFAALTLEQQAAVRKNEDKREAVTQKVKTEAQEARKAALAEIETVRGISSKLESVIPDKIAEFKQKYDNVDWVAAARDYPTEYPVWHAQMLADREGLEKSIAAKAEADKVAQAAFIREQGEMLREIAPDLVAKPEDLKALGGYILQQGFSSEDVQSATAQQLVMANKARLWDEAQSKAAATAALPRTKQPPVKTVPPVASVNKGTHQQRLYTESRQKLAKSGSDADAITAIMRGGL